MISRIILPARLAIAMELAIIRIGSGMAGILLNLDIIVCSESDAGLRGK